MFTYWGFGLQIASEIPFPELYPVSFVSEADVTIRLGVITTIPEGASFFSGRTTYTMNDREMVFTVKDVATYHISEGHTIVLQPENSDVEKRVLRMFILGGAMAAVLQQRHILPMHAAGVLKDEQLTLIAGHSGAGKSTTLAGLMREEYRVFSDDVTVLTPDGYGTASYPMLKLWEQSMQVLNCSDRSFPVMPGMEKFGVFFHEHFDRRSYPVKKIILLEVSEDDQFTIAQLKGGNAFAAVVAHIFKPSFFNTPTMRMVKFNIITQLLQHTTIYHISRPSACIPDQLLSRVMELI